ncbi:hypothetical protein H0H81_000284 [Sphagnurus paluster]|uniref:Uncharacterized protein n=1 Tax=Sphagnurus paluster TaxID=117069 RepID=A0A9P7FXX8_9AGAR|nr:hypothetical protein H0H81_000284 [Sphagnurus paluster]
MSRYTLILLLNLILIVHATSHPVTFVSATSTGTSTSTRSPAPAPTHAPGPRRDLFDLLEDDAGYNTPNTHGGGGGGGGMHEHEHETYWTTGTTFSFGGVFPDELLRTRTGTDGQLLTGDLSSTSTTSTSATSSTSGASVRATSQTTASATSDTVANTVIPTSSGTAPNGNSTDAYDAPSGGLAGSEAARWKVIGLVVICITFVGAAILTVVFFDAWWGFVKAVVCRRRGGGGTEDMVPDWEKRCWEYKLPSEDGHGEIRYPATGAGDGAGAGLLKREVSGAGAAGVGAGMRSPFVGVLTSPQPVYTPLDSDPHPLAPLGRRPSNRTLLAYP